MQDIDRLVQLLNELESGDKSLRSQAESLVEQTDLEKLVSTLLLIISTQTVDEAAVVNQMRAAIYLKNRVLKVVKDSSQASLAGGQILPLLMSTPVLMRPKKIASHIAVLIGTILRKFGDALTIPSNIDKFIGLITNPTAKMQLLLPLLKTLGEAKLKHLENEKWPNQFLRESAVDPELHRRTVKVACEVVVSLSAPS